MQYGLHVRTFWTALSVFIQVLQLTWEYCCLFLEKLDATLQRKFFLHWLNQHVYQFSSKMDKKTRKQRDSSLFLMWKTVARIMRKHNVPVVMKPYKTFKTVLLNRMCVQSFLCQLWQDLHWQNWKEVWTLESDYRNTRLKWNPKQDAHSLVTRSLRASSSTEHNKSALTEHATQENHVINWSQATVIDRQPECFTRWIKEAIHVRKEGQQAWTVMRAATNWATHTTTFLTRHLPVVSRTVRTEYQLLLMKASDRGRNVKF